jgi:hypothetical protein
MAVGDILIINKAQSDGGLLKSPPITNPQFLLKSDSLSIILPSSKSS